LQAVKVFRLEAFFRSAIFLVPVCLFIVNLGFCTVSRLVSGGLRRRYGPDLVHIGLLVLIAGGLTTALGRQEITWPLLEGEQAEIGSGYTMRLLSLQFIRYDDGSPRDWISTVEVLRGGRQEVASYQIKVNHPLRLRGLTVYQSSWDVRGTLQLKGSDSTEVASPSPGDYFDQGDSRWMFAAYQRDAGTWAVLFQRFRNGKLAETRILHVDDTIGPFTVIEISAQEISGLKTVRDPGLGLFLAGAILVTVGLCLTFIRRGDIAE
jgi:cytochrome c biogenesis protein ResB